MYPTKTDVVETDNLNPHTIKEYVTILNRLKKRGYGHINEIASKSTARCMRAALGFAIKNHVMNERVDLSTWQLCADVLNLFGGRSGAIKFLEQFSTQDLGKRVGRVKKLYGLPKDWWQLMVEASASETPIEHASVIALSQCGFRPSELQGIVMCVSKNNLFIRINGSKLSERSGQDIRVIVFEITGQLHKLASLCPDDRSFVSPFQFINERRLERLVEKASNAVFGNPRRVNCSAFRNNVASIMKSRGWDSDQIARMLGHQSERTQKFYGRARLSKNSTGWIAPVRVKASTEPRPVKSPHARSQRQTSSQRPTSPKFQ